MSSSPGAAAAPLNVPNLLSLSRLPLAVVLFVCIAHEEWAVGLAVFALAAFTDWLDGWWARRFRRQTPVGRALDPLTDKVLIGGAFVYFIPVRDAGVDPWMVAVVISRELLVTGLRGMVEATGQQFGADWFGKLKTALQSLTVAAILLHLTLHASALAGLAETLAPVVRVLLYAMLAATVGSLVQYTVKAWRLLR